MATIGRAGHGIWKTALVTVPAIVIVGTLMGYLSNSGFSNSWYAGLVKPAFQPPSWAFGVVWPILYALMGIAAWLVWRVGGFRAARAALSLFLVQLAVNALWSWLFFAWHLGALAFVDILLLWVLVLATLVAFWRIRPLAGAMLVPYLLWISFAAALNLSVWQLNPQVLG